MAIFDFLRRKSRKIELALSGGALHGAAHIGVLKVLEREGIFPEIVAGTSAGAIIGSAYAAGVSISVISEMFRKASWPDIVKISLKNKLSLFDTQPLESFIKKNIGNFTFETLPRKFAVVACELLSGKRVVLEKGPVAPAVRASAAFPGILSPVKIEGRLLVDGGVVDNLPAELVHEMGADYVIAVDLSTPIQLCCNPESLFEIVMAVINLMQARSALPPRSLMDCYIKPDVSDLSAWSFGDSKELEKRGILAAEKVIQQLKIDLGIR